MSIWQALRPAGHSVVLCIAVVGAGCNLGPGPQVTLPAEQYNPDPVATPASTCLPQGQPVVLAAGQAGSRLLAVDAEYVYWTTSSSPNGGSETIWKVAKGGATPSAVVRDVASLGAIAAYAGDLYWSVSASGQIFRLPRGSIASQLVLSFGRPTQLAVSRHGIYWLDSAAGSVMRANTDGTAAGPVAEGQRGAGQLQLDDSDVFWMNNEGHKVLAYTVMKAPLAGGPVTSIAGDQQIAQGFALDAEHVYITTMNQLLRVGKDGTGLRLLATDQSVTGAPAVDSTRVYWAVSTPAGPSVMSTPKDASTPATLAATLTFPVAVATDLTSVYWLTKGDSEHGFTNGALNTLCK